MFSSNQVIKISGELNPTAIANVLKFIKSAYNEKWNCFKIAEDGTFILGNIYDLDKEDWEKFQFEYDDQTLGMIICNHLRGLKYHDDGWDFFDGSTYEGFICEDIEMTWATIQFKPFTTFYAK